MTDLIAIVGLCTPILIIIIFFLIWRKLGENEKIKYEFITIITHKFRTPLTHIKWSSEALLLTEKDGEKRQSLLDVKESSEKLIGMTGTLVELLNIKNTWKSIYNFESISLCEYVKAIAEPFISGFTKKAITFEIKCSDKPVHARVDKERMKYVIQTLLENASNYTPRGGKVTVSIEKSIFKAHISVSDTGIGINQKDITRLFTKFFRSESAVRTDTEGLGIGLFLAQSIVKRHKGKIKVYSQGENRGSTFTIVLPKA